MGFIVNDKHLGEPRILDLFEDHTGIQLQIEQDGRDAYIDLTCDELQALQMRIAEIIGARN